MAKKRKDESAEQRHDREIKNARKRADADAAADKAVDAMVKRSIDSHGA